MDWRNRWTRVWSYPLEEQEHPSAPYVLDVTERHNPGWHESASFLRYMLLRQPKTFISWNTEG